MTTLLPASDTDPEVYARHLALLRGLSKSERLMKTLALSAFVRKLAFAGATQHSGAAGPEAVRERFLEQLYGSDMTDDLRRLIARI